MVLVTGATGLLGSYLTKLLLSKGEKVRAIKRKNSDITLLGQYADRVEWVEADILDVPALEDAMVGVEKVYHCAAVISFIPREVDYMMKANIEGAANVMNVALASGVKKVVHVSSVAAFGLPRAGKTIDEKYSDPNINKTFWYYKSKHYGEREAWRAVEEGMSVIVACPSTILGAGWWKDEPNSLFREIHGGLKFYSNATNGFVDVRDVAECIYRLMESNISNEKFIISAQNESFKRLMEMMADSLKVKRPTLEATPFLRSLVWRFEFIRSLFSDVRPLITKESAELASINFSYNNQKIKQALNFEFRPIETTIKETAQVFLQSYSEGKDHGLFIAEMGK